MCLPRNTFTKTSLQQMVFPAQKFTMFFQDSRGYIWFATDNGVSRYNGYEFQNFDVNDGLATNSTSEIYEDYKGRVWFIWDE
jgi:ligand-binding sensor domain-containing protein